MRRAAAAAKGTRLRRGPDGQPAGQTQFDLVGLAWPGLHGDGLAECRMNPQPAGKIPVIGDFPEVLPDLLLQRMVQAGLCVRGGTFSNPIQWPAIFRLLAVAEDAVEEDQRSFWIRRVLCAGRCVAELDDHAVDIDHGSADRELLGLPQRLLVLIQFRKLHGGRHLARLRICLPVKDSQGRYALPELQKFGISLQLLKAFRQSLQVPLTVVSAPQMPHQHGPQDHDHRQA